MPFRLDQFRAKVQFTTFAQMPFLVHRAAVAAGVRSNTVYYQIAVCEKLARDLGIPLDQLLGELPIPMGPSAKMFNPDGVHPMSRYGKPSVPLGQQVTMEDVL